jgi:FixJ family two-component response regulator
MQRKPTIYIVDDEPGIVESLTHLVKPTGADVQSYSSGEEFLKNFRPTGPACLVLDVRMPGMSGLEVQRRLAMAGHGIPVIVITGHGDVKMAVEAVSRGALSFWEKPFCPDALLGEIRAALQRDEEEWSRRSGNTFGKA